MKKKQHPKLPIGEHTLQHVTQTVPKDRKRIAHSKQSMFQRESLETIL